LPTHRQQQILVGRPSEQSHPTVLVPVPTAWLSNLGDLDAGAEFGDPFCAVNDNRRLLGKAGDDVGGPTGAGGSGSKVAVGSGSGSGKLADCLGASPTDSPGPVVPPPPDRENGIESARAGRMSPPAARCGRSVVSTRGSPVCLGGSGVATAE
jgi:hypothetical protein